MDPRLYIVAGTFILLLGSLVYLLVAASRSRKEHEAARAVLVGLGRDEERDTDREAGEPVEIDWPESGTPAAQDVLSAPLRIGDWRPEPSAEGSPAGYTGPSAPVVPDEQQAHAADAEPEASPEPAVVAEVERVPETLEPPKPPPAPVAPLETPTVAPAEPVSSPKPELLQTPGSLPVAREVPKPTVPAPGPLTEPEPAPEPEPLPELGPASGIAPEPVSEVVPEPDSEPLLEPEPLPEVDLLPEVEPVAEVVPEPPVAHRAGEAPPAPPVATPIDDSWLDTVMPQVAVGEAEPPAEPAPGRDAPEFDPVSPVEMWFGDTRVGVKEGTKTFELFQRYASSLLEELSRAREGS